MYGSGVNKILSSDSDTRLISPPVLRLVSIGAERLVNAGCAKGRGKAYLQPCIYYPPYIDKIAAA